MEKVFSKKSFKIDEVVSLGTKFMDDGILFSISEIKGVELDVLSKSISVSCKGVQVADEGGKFTPQYKLSIRAARVNADLTSAEAAELLKIARQTLTIYEDDENKIPKSRIQDIVNAYKIPVEYLKLSK